MNKRQKKKRIMKEYEMARWYIFDYLHENMPEWDGVDRFMEVYHNLQADIERRFRCRLEMIDTEDCIGFSVTSMRRKQGMNHG